MNWKNHHQIRAAQKQFEWLACSMPYAACGGEQERDSDGRLHGIAVPPNERGCGQAHPMRGTNEEDLTDWCISHET